MGELTIRSAQAQRNLLEWSQRVAECRSSGQSVTRWCAEHDIKPKTYFNWQKKVFAAMIEQQRQQLEAPQEPERRFAALRCIQRSECRLSSSTVQGFGQC